MHTPKPVVERKFQGAKQRFAQVTPFKTESRPHDSAFSTLNQWLGVQLRVEP
jgi:hypothetical protein